MKLFGLTIQREATQAAPTPAAQATETTTTSSGADFLGNIVHINRENSCLTLPAVFRGITLRANTMAKLTAQYQRRDTTGGNFIQDMGPTRGRHINYLLQVRPNPYMGWGILMKQLEIRRILWGNAYIYVERGMDDEIKAFWLCSSASYVPTSDTYNVTHYVGNLIRTVGFVPSRDVLHFRFDMMMDGFNGIGLLGYAQRTFSLAATQQQLTLDTTAKGGIRKLVVQEQQQSGWGLGKSTKDQMNTIAKTFAEDLNLKDVTYLPNVAGFKDISQTLAELELLASRRWSTVEIANFLSIPVQYLGDAGSSNYKTPEFATLDLLSNCIAPTIEEIEDEMNAKLLDETDFDRHRYHLCENALFRLDRQSQTLWNKNRMETGVVSINELRAEQELGRIDNGDDHYVSTNLAVAGSPKLSGVDTKVTAKEEL